MAMKKTKAHITVTSILLSPVLQLNVHGMTQENGRKLHSCTKMK